MTGNPYDDAAAVSEYLVHNHSELMSQFEQRCLRVALQRTKAAQNESIAKLLPEWLAEEEASVVVGSIDGYEATRRRIGDRLAQHVADETVAIKRCPKCNCVVRTPLARQCLWCGHDWHDRAV